jgi:hypothetical protein
MFYTSSERRVTKEVYIYKYNKLTMKFTLIALLQYTRYGLFKIPTTLVESNNMHLLS